MYTRVMATAMVAWLAAGHAAAQDRSSQPPVATGETTGVTRMGTTPSSSADVGAQAQALNNTGLDDIVITAQRKSESAQRAAIAINVVGGSDLLSAGITSAPTLGRVVPALTIENVGGSNSLFIRGVGNFSVSVTSDPAVAFNIDGVYVGRNTAIVTAFFDLDRVEVLKGPQGTLYGRNATAGAINILPTQPKIGEWSGFGTVSYGNYNALQVEGAVNAPLGENGAVRVSAVVNNRSGYNLDGTSDDKSFAIRTQIKDNLTPTLTARLAFDYSHIGGAGEGVTYLDTYGYNAAIGQFVVTPTGLPRSDGNLSPASQAFWTSLNTLSVAGRKRDPFPQIYQNSDFFGTNGDVEWDTGAGVLTVIPAVRWDQLRNLNPGGGFPIVNRQNDVQESVEARYAGKIASFDYTVGVFYYNETVDLRQGTVVGGSSASFAYPTDQHTDSYAPFGRLTWHATDRLRFVAGVRYTHDSKQFNATAGNTLVTCVLPAGCPTAILPVPAILPAFEPFPVPNPGSPPGPAGPPGEIVIRGNNIVFNNHLSTGRVTYRGAAEYDLRPSSLLYASVESGFRSGGFSTSVGYETYQPEYITAYTVGSKNRFFDNRLQLNLEAFYWDYSNQQVAHAGLDQLGRAGNFTQNIGSSRMYGAELETRALVTPTTTLSADVQYLDAKNKSFIYTQATGLGVPYTNCAVAPPANGVYTINCSGLPSYNSPKWTLNLGAEQVVPVGDYRLVFSVDTQYKSGRYTYFDYQPQQFQTANFVTNAQVTFGPKSERWSIAGYVRNIENDRLLVAPVAFLGLLTSYTSPPRTYGGRVSVKF